MPAANPIRIALPSKGQLEESTLDFLAGCGLHVDKTNPRQYRAGLPALPQAQVLFQRARDIPRSVAAGDIDLGITGYDAVTETLDENLNDIVVIHEALGYGVCELVVAVPNDWRDADTMAGLAARARTRDGLRAATKYENTARRFLASHGLAADVHITTSDGALEAAPTIGYADFIVDITSSGTTLRENNLKILADGVIMRSQATLIGNRRALQTRDNLIDTTHHLLELIEGYLRARGQYLVFANMRGESAEAIGMLIATQTDLGGLQGPTIAQVISKEGNGWWAINIVVSSDRLYNAIRQIRAIGGSGVIATPAAYIFEERPARYLRLLAEVGRTEITR